MDARRPRYRKLSPIGYWVSWLFVPFNLVLAYYLFRVPFEPLHWTAWGIHIWPVFFTGLAIMLSYAMLKNDMRKVRMCMMLGVLAKAIWAWILFVLALQVGFVESLYLLDFWFFILIIQMVVAIFTPPRIDYDLIR